MTAVGGVLPLFNMLHMPIDMDSCLGLSRGVRQNNLCLAQRSLITQAPSGCSSTMVNPQEHEDSGLSQSAPDSTSPPQPQSAHDSAPFSLPEAHDTHRTQAAAEVVASEHTGASPASSPDKNPDPSNPAPGVEGQATGEGDAPLPSEEAEGGPPKKRARTIPEDKKEGSATANTPERSHSDWEPAAAADGPSISLGRSPSERETGGTHSRSQPEAKPWWLTTAPAAQSQLQTSTFDMGSADGPLQRLPQQQPQPWLLQQQQMHQLKLLQQQQQRQQEREFFPKQPPVYDPDMLSSMESGHDRAGTTPGELRSGRDWPDRPYSLPRQDTPELPFFTQRESPVQRSTSGHSGEEAPPPRPASSGQSKGKEPAVLDTFGHGAHMAEIGLKGLPVRHPSPVEGQQRFPGPFLQGGPGQPGFPGPAVNPSFYARYLGSMPYDSGASMFIQPPISHGRPPPGMPGQRPVGHMEMVPPSLMQQPASNEMAMQKLSPTPPTFLPRFQPSDAARLAFPYSPYDVMQSAQRPQQLPVGRPAFRGPAHGTMQQPFEMRPGSGPFLPPFAFPPPDPQRPSSQVPLSRPIAAGGFQHLFPPSQGHPAYGRPGLQWGLLPGPDISTDLYLERAGFDAVSQGQGPVVPVVPAPVAVVVEGRDMGLRMNLQDFNSYESFAAQLRSMLYSNISTAEDPSVSVGAFNPSTAIPGYQITYEDEEGDTLLAGDTSWREFVRLAKRIKILAIKRSSRPAGTS